MASGGREKKNSDQSGSSSIWGILGGLAGGLALGGLAVYGATKLVEVLGADEAAGGKEEGAACKTKQIDSDDEDDSRSQQRESASSYSYQGNTNTAIYHGDASSLGIGTYSQNPNIRSCTSASNDHSTSTATEDIDRSAEAGDLVMPGNLSDQLNDYLENYVNISQDELQNALRLVALIEVQLRDALATTNLPLDQFIHTGSGYEGVQIIQPDNFDVHLPLRLNPALWELVNCADSSLHTAGYHLVKRIGWDTGQFGSSPWDRYLDGTYLSPQKLCKHLHGVLQFGLDGIENIQDCILSNNILSVFVQCSEFWSNEMKVNVIPLIKMGETSVCARAHPLVKSHNMEGLKNLWQHNFGNQESDVMKSFDEDGGCQKDCLKILRAMSLHDESFLHQVDPYVLKTVLFHLSCQEDFWERETLPERVIDMFMTLRGFLEQGRLPHYFKPSIDLFEDKTDTFKVNLLAYVQEICAPNRLCSLLEK
ncbi:mitochondrial dynamics protein MID49-like [Lineus longissimus]|uniref:mitochondrial dynamics protein MID49-like n=1 Tax=Lineus longissimus TaxID=88925 RepID=UPI002B4F4277